jgi:hypothetical protein
MTRDDIIRLMEWHPSFDRNQTDGLLARIERVAQAAAAAERNRMIADGWRQCAQGQRTTQFCAQAADRLARHGIPMPGDDDGNPSF